MADRLFHYGHSFFVARQRLNDEPNQQNGHHLSDLIEWMYRFTRNTGQ